MPSRIIFPEKGKVTLAPFNLAVPGTQEVRVRTQYSLMSIGTELTILHERYEPTSHFAKMFSFPQLKTGVQAIGFVEEKGTDVTDYEIGDRVFMRMAHGSHQLLAAAQCSPVPRNIDSKLGCWCGLAKTAFRAAWAGKFDVNPNLVVLGAGPVGQMTIRWARTMNVQSIVVNDLSAFRLEIASLGGATKILQGDVAEHLDDIGASLHSDRPTVVVDTTGNAQVFNHALAVAPMFAKIILLGDTGYPSKQRLTSAVMTKGLTIQAVHDSHDRGGWTQRRIDERFFQNVDSGIFDLHKTITHEYSPDQCAQAYSLAEAQRGSTMGILYDWTQATK